MADRPQNRKKNGKRRPVYDQARDTRPSRPVDRSNVGYPSATTPGRSRLLYCSTMGISSDS